MKEQKRNRRRFVTIRVTKQTYDHLCTMAELAGKKYPGEIVDKLVRNIRIMLREKRYLSGGGD